MANEQVLTAEQVIDKARSYLSDEHIAFVEKAYLYAEDAHREQYRKSGEPYIIHPIQVAGILVDLEMDGFHNRGRIFARCRGRYRCDAR